MATSSQTPVEFVTPVDTVFAGIPTSNTYPESDFQHVVCVCTYGGLIKMYVNGARVIATNAVNPTLIVASMTRTYHYLGQTPSQDNGHLIMKFLRIYNTSLSLVEAQALYAARETP